LTAKFWRQLDDKKMQDDSAKKRMKFSNRWFCYLDLLGFTNLIRNGEAEHVIPLYNQVVKELRQQVTARESLDVSYSWFSDTFIIFSNRNTLREFDNVQTAARKFFVRLLLARIPVRGAISYGKLYTQKDDNIFIGEALIEAYEYGEKQDWLGLLLSPSISHYFGGLPEFLRDFYRPPHKSGIITHARPNDVYAYGFREPGKDNDAFLVSLRAMRDSAPPEARIIRKYTNAEEFILEACPDGSV